MKKLSFMLLCFITLCSPVFSQSEKSLTTYDKIYGLSEIWKEVSYNFAFFDQIPNLNWDSCYMAFIPQVMKTTSDWEYYRVLQKFMSLLKDGHTRVFPTRQLRNKYYGTATKSLTTRLIADKVIVTDVIDNRLAEAGLVKGMEIIAIDNQGVKEYADENVKPYMFASTSHDLILQTYGHFLLSGSTSEPAIIQVKGFDGELKKFTVYRQPWIMELEMYSDKPFSYKVLPNNIGYLQIHNFVITNEYQPIFDSIYIQILKTDGLIIDVRNNFGGATQMTHYVLKHFTNGKIGTVNWNSPMNIGAHKAWGTKQQWYEVTGKEIDGFTDRIIYTKPLNIVADESSFSGAEDFCLGFLTMKRGKLVGRKTAGSTGSPIMSNLFGDDLVLICAKKDFFPDGTEFIGYGINPDIEVKLSIEDVINGIDKSLNVAIDSLSSIKKD